jgi:hypothetical protein
MIRQSHRRRRHPPTPAPPVVPHSERPYRPDEVVFQPTLVAVIDRVVALVDVPRLDLAVVGDVRVPAARVAAGRVVRLARLLAPPDGPRRGVAPDDPPADDVRRGGRRAGGRRRGPPTGPSSRRPATGACCPGPCVWSTPRTTPAGRPRNSGRTGRPCTGSPPSRWPTPTGSSRASTGPGRMPPPTTGRRNRFRRRTPGGSRAGAGPGSPPAASRRRPPRRRPARNRFRRRVPPAPPLGPRLERLMRAAAEAGSTPGPRRDRRRLR